MQKRWVSQAIIGFLVVFVATAAWAQQPATGKVIKWKFQSHWPSGSTSFKPLKDFFEKDLTKLTGGQLQITLYPAAALVPTKEIFDSARKGTIDGATASPIYWMGIIPITAIASNCPMTFHEPWEGLYFHYLLGFEDMMKEAHAKFNLLYYTEKIYPTALISKKPIRKIEDFKGLKIRSSGAIADFLKDLGAATNLIPGEELYLALQTGVVEAAHWGAAGGGPLHEVSRSGQIFHPAESGHGRDGRDRHQQRGVQCVAKRPADDPGPGAQRAGMAPDP